VQLTTRSYTHTRQPGARAVDEGVPVARPAAVVQAHRRRPGAVPNASARHDLPLVRHGASARLAGLLHCAPSTDRCSCMSNVQLGAVGFFMCFLPAFFFFGYGCVHRLVAANRQRDTE
jgi:hypothetical protein